MNIPKGAVIAVVDGKHLKMFRNAGDEASPNLVGEQEGEVVQDNSGSGGRHRNSSANPDGGQGQEDDFASGVAELLNKQVLGGHIKDLIIVAAPRTLGELRMHYHQKLSDVLVGEVAKDLTGHSAQDIEKALSSIKPG